MNEEITLEKMIKFCEKMIEESKVNHGYYTEIKMTLEEILDRQKNDKV